MTLKRTYHFVHGELLLGLVEQEKEGLSFFYYPLKKLIGHLVCVLFLTCQKHYGIGQEIKIFSDLTVFRFNTIQVRGVHHNEMRPVLPVVFQDKQMIGTSSSRPGMEIFRGSPLRLNGGKGKGLFDRAVSMNVGNRTTGFWSFHSCLAQGLSAQCVEKTGFTRSCTANEDQPETGHILLVRKNTKSFENVSCQSVDFLCSMGEAGTLYGVPQEPATAKGISDRLDAVSN